VAGVGVTEGMLPSEPGGTPGSCVGLWTTPTVAPAFAQVGSTGTIGSPAPACSHVTAGWRCTFKYSGTPTVRLRASATNIAGAFRAKVSSADLSFSGTETLTANLSTGSLATTGIGTASVEITMPNRSTATTVSVTIKDPITLPADMTSNTSAKVWWFFRNGWDRYTYYALAPVLRASGAVGLPCTNPGDAGCVSVNGLAAGTGNANDKKVVLALMGRAIGAQTQTTLEAQSHTLPALAANTSVPTAFTVSAPSSTVNDRIATCPFNYTAQAGPLSPAICN